MKQFIINICRQKIHLKGYQKVKCFTVLK